MDESQRRPQVAIGHMWLKVSDISGAAQYFVSLGLRPIHQAQGIAILELRGEVHT
jgi:catechol-2,3-dioxygenase